MVDVNKAVIARLKKGGETFEILVDCDKAVEFKTGKGDLSEVLATEGIFKDVKKGQRASESEIKRIFQTDDPDKVAETIIKKGEIQLTTEHRNRLREEKKRAIINIIHRNAINTQTNAPHPPQRIESALEQAKVHIDEFKKPEEQIAEILSKIRTILPIKFEIRELSVKIPPDYATKTYSLLKLSSKLINDMWQEDGSLLAMIEIPAGIQEEFEEKLNKATQGNVEIRILKKR